jgi:branched-subunit amino acid aminotransferase/4-amino-4-deoxychorismate lyase
MLTTVAAAGEPLLVEVDGAPAGADALAPASLLPGAHLTALQVRDGAVRGLDLHLARLAAAHLELFGSVLDTASARALMAQAVRDHPSSYLRVVVDEPTPGTPRVVTVVRAPLDAPTTPQSLAPVAYVRPSAHLKHTGTFGRDLHGQAARRKGFDDALLVAPDGQIAETSIANIGFVRAGHVVWPTGPALQGISWQLIDLALVAAGTPATTERIRVDDKGGYDGAFLTSSLGVAPVGRIGTHAFADPAVTSSVTDLYASVPWDTL